MLILYDILLTAVLVAQGFLIGKQIQLARHQRGLRKYQERLGRVLAIIYAPNSKWKPAHKGFTVTLGLTSDEFLDMVLDMEDKDAEN